MGIGEQFALEKTGGIMEDKRFCRCVGNECQCGGEPRFKAALKPKWSAVTKPPEVEGDYHLRVNHGNGIKPTRWGIAHIMQASIDEGFHKSFEWASKDGVNPFRIEEPTIEPTGGRS